MKRYGVVIFLCFSFMIFRAPLTFSEIGRSWSGTGTAFAADDCPGAYQYWTGSYTPGTGGVCKPKLGIDPHSSINDCKPGQTSIKLCDDRAGSNGKPMYKTCTLSCSGSSVIQKAQAALKAALSALATLKSGANTDLANMKTLLNDISSLLNTINQNSNLLSNSIATVNTSLANLNAYLVQGKLSGQRASEILARQLATALAQQGIVAGVNKQTQGCTIGDPVFLASGVEDLKLEDLSYRTINSLIEIQRRYTSNKTTEDSPFGKGWSFNYDTRIIVGRSPLVKERAAILADYLPGSPAGDLAAKASAELTKAVNALNAAQSYSSTIQQNTSSIQTKLGQLKQEHQDTYTKYEKAKNYQAEAEKNAAIIGTSAASSDAAKAKSIRMEIKDIADVKEPPLENTATSNYSTAQSAGQNAASKIASVQSSVNGGQAKVNEVTTLNVDLKNQAVLAAAEVTAETADFPDNPFPADESLYFGKGFLKLIEGNGSPILFEIQADKSYKPVTDNGSYTDRIYAIEGGFQVVSKHGEIREYGRTGKGYALLAKKIDVNGNQTVFNRTDERLTAIIDPVGRKTEFTYDNDGHITGITDPLGRIYTYAYENGRLVQYTDPMKYVWGYQYDEGNRLIGRTDPQNNTYRYVYDAEGRVAKEIDKEGYEISYTYDPVKKLTVKTDRRGQKTQYYYNDNNRLERVYHPDMSEETFAYDGRNNVVAKKDENGQTTSFTYNEFNDILTSTDALHQQTSITYEPRFNKVASITDARGKTRSFSYDERGNLLSIQHPDGTTRTFTYSSVGLPVTSTDENGNVSQFSYDAYGQLSTITLPDGSSKNITADILGRVVAISDELGNTTKLDYNTLGSVTKVTLPPAAGDTDPAGPITQYVYDELQRKIQEINPNGGVLQFQYSKRGNVTSVIDPLGNTLTSVYDGEENQIKTTYPNSTGVDITYDSRNRVIRSLTFPGNRETLFTYDSKGNRLTAKDANGNTTAVEYDAIGRPVAKTDALGAVTRSEYDPVGNLLKVIDANSNPIDYVYDDRNRLIQTVNALGKATTITYDGVGNVIKKEKADGAVLQYVYDKRNRLTQVSYPDNTRKTYAYDAAGRMIKAANKDGEEGEETRAYNTRGQLITVTDKYLGQIGYAYDPAGNRTKIVDPDNGEQTFVYNVANQLTTFTDANGKTTTYTYDSMGREIGKDLPNFTRTTKSYDLENRLTAIQSTGEGSQEISEAYTYDAVGNKLSATDADGWVTEYQYDSVYRLLGANSQGAAGDGTRTAVPASSKTYTYDPVGNRLTYSDGTKTVNYQYNAANQLLQAGDISFAYDANGNRVEKNASTGKVKYAYTYDDLLAKVDDAGKAKVTSYGYDGLNRRTFKASGSQVQVSYLYDGLEVLQEVAGADTERIMTYFRANNQIVSRQEKSSITPASSSRMMTVPPQSQQQFYVYDGLGSVSALTTDNGSITDRYQYDAFGEFTKTLNSEEDPEDVFNNAYTFTGRRIDTESGLYTFHFRQYDPGTGVWTTPDPIGILGGVNLYAYVGNNPVNWVDLLGLVDYCSDPNNTCADVNGGQEPGGGSEGSSVGTGDGNGESAGGMSSFDKCIDENYNTFYGSYDTALKISIFGIPQFCQEIYNNITSLLASYRMKSLIFDGAWKGGSMFDRLASARKAEEILGRLGPLSQTLSKLSELTLPFSVFSTSYVGTAAIYCYASTYNISENTEECE